MTMNLKWMSTLWVDEVTNPHWPYITCLVGHEMVDYGTPNTLKPKPGANEMVRPL
jgi:hypothetical protein